MTTTTLKPYFSISTLAVRPENVAKVVEFMTKVSAETEKKEPGALIYRWYKSAVKEDGKTDFVFIEKFESLEAYRAHQQSEHVQGLYREYLEYMPDPFVFHHLDTEENVFGGFDRP